MATMASLLAVAVLAAGGNGVFFSKEEVFDPEKAGHGHVHASCIVECPNGGLRVVWYENGQELPPPYYSENKDKSDDVRIGGARKPAGADTWEPPFVMADTFGLSDNNPCMVIDAEQRLWLFYPTLMGVPEWTWPSALMRYRWASDYAHPGPVQWDKSGILVPHVAGLRDKLEALLAAKAEQAGWDAAAREKWEEEIEQAFANPLIGRLGWMPRAHPLIRSDGALVLPLSNENFGLPCMAITKDAGETWTISDPVPGLGLTQPTLVEFDDGQIAAFFRISGPPQRIRRSESDDGGLTWDPVSNTTLANPGAGIEAILLDGGGLMMVYNDKEESPRDRLAVSISADRGKTWQWTRHIENSPGERFDYPSVIQASDGSIHVTYSYNTKVIRHARFSVAWVKQAAQSAG